MKSILIIFTLTLFANITFAQTTKLVTESEKTTTARSSNIEGMEFNNVHTQSAVKQLQNFSTKNIKYPDHLAEFGLEGTVVVEVAIQSNGTIENLKIAKSLSPAFDKAVLKEMKNCKNLDFLGENYKGKPTIHLPVRFSLK